jgi:hypothetical protein
MSTEQWLNLVLILDTKLTEIENSLSLATELGFIIFKASNNIPNSLFFYWLPLILKILPSVSSDLILFLQVPQETYELIFTLYLLEHSPD